MHGFRALQLPAARLVKGTSGFVAFVGPKLHALIAAVLCMAHAGLQKPFTEPLAPSFRDEQEQPQLCRGFGQSDTENRAKALAFFLRNPPAFQLRIMPGEEGIQDIAHQNAETVIKPFGFCIETTMLIHEPVSVIGGKLSDDHTVHARTKTQVVLPFNPAQASDASTSLRRNHMGIDTEREIEANLQIGPTDKGMVRIYIESQGLEIPMDFSPDDADEIADEITAAANRARTMRGGKR